MNMAESIPKQVTKEILDLHEALAFYELHCFHMLRESADASLLECRMPGLPVEALPRAARRRRTNRRIPHETRKVN
jgi:hypothetical protein